MPGDAVLGSSRCWFSDAAGAHADPPPAEEQGRLVVTAKRGPTGHGLIQLRPSGFDGLDVQAQGDEFPAPATHGLRSARLRDIPLALALPIALHHRRVRGQGRHLHSLERTEDAPQRAFS